MKKRIMLIALVLITIGGLYFMNFDNKSRGVPKIAQPLEVTSITWLDVFILKLKVDLFSDVQSMYKLAEYYTWDSSKKEDMCIYLKMAVNKQYEPAVSLQNLIGTSCP